MPKIAYPNKQTAVDPNSPAANEIFTAANANEIKDVVNAIDDLVGSAGAVPEVLTISFELAIAWQTDLIPSGTLTYFERYGNIPPKPYGYGPDWINTNGFSVVIVWDGLNIDTVTFNADLYPTYLIL